MSDLRDLPDLATDVRERVVPPPYDEVTRRVRAQRRRTVGGTLAAAVLVVAGVAVWQSTGTTAAPQPTGPSPSPTDGSWQSVVAGEMAHPFEVSGTDDGAIAVVWRSLVHPEPTFALVIREADGTVHGRRLDVPVDLTPVTGGWVGVHTARGWFISTDGTWTDLLEATDDPEPRPGDVIVQTRGQLRAYSPTSHDWGALPAPERATDAYLTPDGALTVCTVDDGSVHVWHNGGAGLAKVDVGLTGRSCMVAGNADTVAVAGLGDAPNGGIPLTGLLVSHDGGTTWERISGLPHGLSMNSMATTGGATVLGFDDGRQITVRPGQSYEIADGTHGWVFGAGGRVYALSYARNQGPLEFSDDDGRTWQQTTLPGMESSEE